MEKVTTRQESLGAQAAPAMKYPSNLTERQWEVLQLLAQGKTNREIAQALVRTPTPLLCVGQLCPCRPIKHARDIIL